MLQINILPLAAWIALASTMSWSQAREHKHESKQKSALILDKGKKWATDAPLRAGMTHIRAIAQDAAKKNTSEENLRAADRMTAETQNIFKNCKLSPQADGVLHLILTDIISNIAALKSPKANASEVYKNIFKALGTYEQTFDHPGWNP